MDDITRLPLFPLGVVLLPGLPLPLHIFEDRYQDMINDCVEYELEFGVVYYDGNKLRSNGCAARIDEIIKRYDDGRMDIMTVGTRRFRVSGIDSTRSYLQGDCEFYEDSDRNTDTSQIEEYRIGALDALRQFAQFSDSKIDTSTLETLDATSLSFLIAGTDAFGAPEKQRLLEIDSTRERLQKCIAALERTLERLRLNEEIKQIIGTNGHIPDAFGG